MAGAVVLVLVFLPLDRKTPRRGYVAHIPAQGMRSTEPRGCGEMDSGSLSIRPFQMKLPERIAPRNSKLAKNHVYDTTHDHICGCRGMRRERCRGPRRSLRFVNAAAEADPPQRQAVREPYPYFYWVNKIRPEIRQRGNVALRAASFYCSALQSLLAIGHRLPGDPSLSISYPVP
jgi:hypothetical protein